MAKSDNTPLEDMEVKTGELARVLNLTPRRLQQLSADGYIEQVARGTYQLGRGVQQYCNFIQGNSRSEEELTLDLRQKAASVKLKEAQATIKHLEAAELEGSMFRAEDIEALQTDFVYHMKAQIMALPARLAVDMAAEDDPRVCSEIIKGEVRRLLTEISLFEFDPEKYMDRVRERRQMELRFMKDEPDEE